MDANSRIRHLEREIRLCRLRLAREHGRTLLRQKQLLKLFMQKDWLEQRFRVTQDQLALERKRLLPVVKRQIELLARQVPPAGGAVGTRQQKAALDHFLNSAWGEMGIELEAITDPHQYLARAGYCMEALLDFLPEVAYFIGMPLDTARDRAYRFVTRRMVKLERDSARALRTGGFSIPSKKSIASETRRFSRRSVLEPILRTLGITEEEWARRASRPYLAVRRYLNGTVRRLNVQTEADLLKGLAPQNPGDVDGVSLLPGGRLPR